MHKLSAPLTISDDCPDRIPLQVFSSMRLLQLETWGLGDEDPDASPNSAASKLCDPDIGTLLNCIMEIGSFSSFLGCVEF